MNRRAISLLLVFALLATSCAEPLRRGVTWLGGEQPLRAPVLETDEAAPGTFVGLSHPSIEADELAPVTVTFAGVQFRYPVLADSAGGVRIPTPVLPELETGERLVEVRVGDSAPASLRVGPLPPPLDATPGAVTRAVLGTIDASLNDALLRLGSIEEALEDHTEGTRLLTEGEEELPPLAEVIDALSAGMFETSWELLESMEHLDAAVQGEGHPVLDTADLVLMDRLLSAWLVGTVEELERTGEATPRAAPASQVVPGPLTDDPPAEPAVVRSSYGSSSVPGHAPVLAQHGAPEMPEVVADALRDIEYHLNLASPLSTLLMAGLGLIATLAGAWLVATKFTLLLGALFAVGGFIVNGLILGGGLTAVEGLLRGEGGGFNDVVAEATAALVEDMAWLGVGELGRVGELLATVRDLNVVRGAIRRVHELTGWPHEGHRAQYEADRERRERRFAIPNAIVHAPTRPHPEYGLPAAFPYGHNHPTPGRPTTQIVAGMDGALQLDVSGVHRWGTSVSINWGCPSMPSTTLRFDRSRSLFVSFAVPESCAGETLLIEVTAADDHRTPRSTRRTVLLEVLHPLEVTPTLATTHPTTGEPVQLSVAVRNAVTRSAHPHPPTVRATWSGDPPDVEPREVRLPLDASDELLALDHTFGRAGRYHVDIAVVDRFGQEADAVIEVEVRDPIELIGVDGPQDLTVGETGAWTVQLQHGWEPVEVQVAFDDGGPPRTLTAASESFTHRFEQPRTYWLSVDVTDAAGGRAHGAVPIEVEGAPVPMPTPAPGPTTSPAPVDPDGLVERSDFNVAGSIECTRDDGKPWGDRRRWQDYTDMGWFRPSDGWLRMDLRHGLAPGPANPIAPFRLYVEPDGSFQSQGAGHEMFGSIQTDAAGNVLGGQGTHAYWYSPSAASVVYECMDHFTITPR